MEYDISEDRISVKGESFSAEYSLDKLYRVTKTKEFLFLFHAKNVASIIPLRDTDASQLYFLKPILETHGVKTNL